MLARQVGIRTRRRVRSPIQAGNVRGRRCSRRANRCSTNTVCLVKHVVGCLPRATLGILSLAFPLETTIVGNVAKHILGSAFDALSKRRGFLTDRVVVLSMFHTDLFLEGTLLHMPPSLSKQRRQRSLYAQRRSLVTLTAKLCKRRSALLTRWREA